MIAWAHLDSNIHGADEVQQSHSDGHLQRNGEIHQEDESPTLQKFVEAYKKSKPGGAFANGGDQIPLVKSRISILSWHP